MHFQTKSPKLSILVPTFNHGKFITECLDSVLAQDFQDYELIISDDASSDTTPEIVSSYKDSRIRLFLNKTNLGMVNHWNWLIAQAKGKYIKFLFGDDKFLHRESVGLLVRSMEEHSEASLAFSQRLLIDPDSKPIRLAESWSGEGVYEGRQVFTTCLLQQKNLVGEPTAVIFRREAAMRGFDVSLRQLVDLEMWMHLGISGKICFIDFPLVAFRVHPAQQTNVNNSIPDLSAREMLSLTTSYFFEESLPSAQIMAVLQRSFRRLPALREEVAKLMVERSFSFRCRARFEYLKLRLFRPFQNLKRVYKRVQSTAALENFGFEEKN
jgi:glycosyltransferase involved in cell wall biosynthesis